jgi:hypothetical protein
MRAEFILLSKKQASHKSILCQPYGLDTLGIK